MKALPALIFNGVEIHDRNEMLCLTDMWRAAGAVEAKRPSNWTRKEGAEFIEHVSLILNVPHGHIQTQRGGSGAGRGATFAHWQIGLAYAKYLSPEFHMWCNTVVRERMEGPALRREAHLPPEVLEMIRRDDGISRMLAHKVTEQGRAVPGSERFHPPWMKPSRRAVVCARGCVQGAGDRKSVAGGISSRRR